MRGLILAVGLLVGCAGEEEVPEPEPVAELETCLGAVEYRDCSQKCADPEQTPPNCDILIQKCTTEFSCYECITGSGVCLDGPSAGLPCSSPSFCGM